MQMPTPSIGWHLAFCGHTLAPPPGEQMMAQLVGELEPWVSSTHWAWLVQPDGTAGHAEPWPLHDGEQKAPDTPWMVTFFSVPEHEVV